MEMWSEVIIALIGMLTGGGLTGIIAWRATKRKAEGEAALTEADALKSIQDVYQQALEDQQKYISQLKETRDHLYTDREDLRKENKELRQQLSEMGSRIQKLEESLTHYARMVEATRLWMCGRMGCQQRLATEFNSNDELVPKKKEKEKK